ncbi:MAG: hypothetical protein LBI04_00425 [Treponema sp.]|jgi:hypothetical protein|nr:hypothetical protein [Treponema sp.]
MTKTDKPKRFNCIEMKTKIQKQIYTETQNMSVDELLRYFNGKTSTKSTTKRFA